MLNQRWNSWGASVIGPLHVKAGIPNQDSWIARQYTWGNVVVVADGLGSKAHSDKGSKAACLAVCEAAKRYRNNPEAKILDILRLIHANWMLNIAPFSSSDCLATCLFAIQMAEIITLGRLGDGIIVAVGDAKENCLILSDNKQDSFSNYTNSLCQTFKPNQWEIATIKSAECNVAILCTDGISDDLLPEKQMTFAQALYSTYADMEPRKRTRDVKRWLIAWPVPGHADDKTIACLFKQGDLR